MLRLEVKCYRADQVTAKCEQSAAAHEQVLRFHNLDGITSAQPGWWQDPETCVLLLEDQQSGEPLGGVRLQRWGSASPLPVEMALASVDARVHDWVSKFADAGVAELCGLWCSPRLAGFGLGSVLIRMGLSLATGFGTLTVLGLCDTRHVSANLGFGFERELSLAAAGSFEYPRPGLFAHVLRIPDATRLLLATHANRARIQEYRDAPTGVEIITRTGEHLELVRDLRLPEARAPRNSGLRTLDEAVVSFGKMRLGRQRERG